MIRLMGEGDIVEKIKKIHLVLQFFLERIVDEETNPAILIVLLDLLFRSEIVLRSFGVSTDCEVIIGLQEVIEIMDRVGRDPLYLSLILSQLEGRECFLGPLEKAQLVDIVFIS